MPMSRTCSRKSSPKIAIAVPQQVARELVKGKCLPQLLSRPLRGWVGGHIEVQNATPVMGQHQKHVKDLEADRGHREEVDGDQLLGVILQECAPSLRRRFAAAHHVFADAALTDVDAELSSSPWMRGAPQVDSPGTSCGSDLGPRGEMTGRPGWPCRTFQVQNRRKPGTMPGDDRFWLDDGQRRAPVAPEAGQTDPQQAVR